MAKKKDEGRTARGEPITDELVGKLSATSGPLMVLVPATAAGLR